MLSFVTSFDCVPGTWELWVKVTLVHSGDRLIEYLGKKASQKALKWLRNKKVEVILNDRYVGLCELFTYYLLGHPSVAVGVVHVEVWLWGSRGFDMIVG